MLSSTFVLKEKSTPTMKKTSGIVQVQLYA